MNFTAIAYFVICAMQILGCYISETENHNDILVFVLKDGFKWLLMPTLALFYYQSVTKPISSFHQKMFLALFFSWLGDVFLIFGTDEKPLFFLLGLVSFLIAHVMYVFTFINLEKTAEKGGFSGKLIFLIPLVAYMGFLLYTLIPSLLADEKKKEMLVPVLVYSSVISAMVVTAVNRIGRVSQQSFQWTFAGALLFMFSDSIIALNKFNEPITNASVYIMLLYTVGQFLIAKGILMQGRK